MPDVSFVPVGLQFALPTAIFAFLACLTFYLIGHEKGFVMILLFAFTAAAVVFYAIAYPVIFAFVVADRNSFFLWSMIAAIVCWIIGLIVWAVATTSTRSWDKFSQGCNVVPLIMLILPVEIGCFFFKHLGYGQGERRRETTELLWRAEELFDQGYRRPHQLA